MTCSFHFGPLAAAGMCEKNFMMMMGQNSLFLFDNFAMIVIKEHLSVAFFDVFPVKLKSVKKYDSESRPTIGIFHVLTTELKVGPC